MTLRYHPEPSTLASYVAGALPQSIAVLVSAHAEMCPACKRDLRVAEAIAGAALVCTPAVAVEEDAFGRLSERMTAAAPYAPPLRAPSDLPRALANLIGGGIDDIPWREVLPGVEHHRYVFRSARGESALRLLRAAPGSEIPDHTHSGQEATLVLRGALGDGGKVFARGEFCDLDDTTTHNPRAHGQEICICAIAEEGPPLFSSPEVATFLQQAGI